MPYRVLLTRTEPGASRQADALLEVGLEPVKLPLLKIEPVACQAADEVPELAVVLSAHAVTHGASVIRGWGNRPRWLAVGKATARALGEVGIAAAHPARESSEGVLALQALEACRGQRVGILCGESPRPLLRQALVARGAHVSEYPVYRRLPLEPISDYHAHMTNLSAVVVSSVEGLRVFADLWNEFWNEHGGARSVLLCVKSKRIAELARELGFDKVRVSSRPTGGGLAHELAGWLRQTT